MPAIIVFRHGDGGAGMARSYTSLWHLQSPSREG